MNDTRLNSIVVANDAAFQSWATGVSDALQDCGLVKTADTGQINTATATKPGVAVTAAGYEIYQLFNDALWATRPFYLKIEYGVGSSVTVASLWVTVGTTTDGAGTLGGQVYARRQLYDAGITATTNQFTTVGDGYVYWLFGTTTTDYMMFGAERMREPDGTLNGNGCLVVATSGTGATQLQFWESATGWGSSISSVQDSVWLGSQIGSPATINDVVVLPSVVPYQGEWKHFGSICYPTANVTAGTTFSVSHLGSSRAFLASGSYLLQPVTGWGIAIPWEA